MRPNGIISARRRSAERAACAIRSAPRTQERFHTDALLDIILHEGPFADRVAMPSRPLADIGALRGICFVMKEDGIVRRCE